jgi:diguanylate cyclase (GGDEF)-like protein
VSFRTRLTALFVGIVLVTMAGFGLLAFRLVDGLDANRADAQARAYAKTVRQRYEAARLAAAPAARRVVRDPALQEATRRGDVARIRDRARVLVRRERLQRLTVVSRGQALADVGDPGAIAPARQGLRFEGGAPAVIALSTTHARRLSASLAGTGAGITLTRAGRPLAARAPGGEPIARASFTAPDFGGRRLRVAVRVPKDTSAQTGDKRSLALAFLVAFLLLALFFGHRVSRALQAQVARFLAAARRLRSGDFSTPVKVRGNDDFSQLGAEFNHMAEELAARLADLEQERGRLRESIRRIGVAFASNLDGAAILELGTQTAVDAVEATGGRATVRDGLGRMIETARAGDVDGGREALAAVESAALAERGTAMGETGDVHALAVPLGPVEPDRPLPGLLAVARPGRPFNDDERALVTSLAGQAAASLENVQLHEQVRRQAVTDELTGLSNHRRFQEALEAELERARRFEQPLGLLMLDVDNFKKVNDTYGHPQGDEVLRAVARILRACSRDVDEPARYGGEEMAVILPQTDLEGAYLAGERVRREIEELEVPRLDGDGVLRITASLGVASTVGAPKDELVACADKALYEAKHSGKNRTVRGTGDLGVVVRSG